MPLKKIIGVIGVSSPDETEYKNAYEAGKLIAQKGFALVTGGMGGVMEAASKGAKEAGGTVLGIIPGRDPQDCNEYVDYSIATGMSEARNAVIVNTAQAFVVIGKGLGTLSEIAFALKQGKPVVGLGAWYIIGPSGEKVVTAKDPQEAVSILMESNKGNPSP
ncbi:TIGR00725 family protein [Elusimicrobiota bacterium]